ncbi:DUF2383 domain-containing protein [Shouchella shacheensis]|uniref:DUF2383 domain-containing protein n=1 Tax=Shouchella shacheensis TaxID=1649580 RepID=UPI00073FB768|nr:DUF2383 domain-containing protein [Shouchella shacheensis]
MQEKQVINELNENLKGEYMGIHAYEHYIEKARDPATKAQLQQIQQDHKQHASKIAERIKNLGGKAVEDNGFMGSVNETMMKLKGVPESTKEIVKGAIKGQEMGIRSTEEIVRGDDLDPESLQIVQSNLDEDRAHIHQLNSLSE